MPTTQEIPTIKIHCTKEPGATYETIQSQKDAAQVIKDFIGDSDRENFVVLLLDRKNKINGINLVSVGSVDQTIVHPREVFKAAILANACGIIIGHNHPSGDCEPSEEDIKMTKRLVKGGAILGIEILDHVIVGEGFYSFREHGRI